MTRPTTFAIATALALLAGCHGTPTVPVANDMAAGDNVAIEDVPPDDLAAPGMPLDSESNDDGVSGHSAM